jgi:hypothetical protein
MTIRVVPATASVGWLRRALNLGRDNPRAIFGGAVLLLVAVLALATVMALATGIAAWMTRPDGVLVRGLSMSFGLAMTALLATLIVGYLRLIDAVEQGRPVNATAVFAAVKTPVLAARAVLFMAALMLAQNLLLVVLVGLFAPDVGNWYLQLLQTPAAGAEMPAGLGMAFVLVWLVSLLAYGVQAIGLGQIALHEQRVGVALLEGISGTVRNLVPLIGLSVLAVAVALVLAIVLVIAAMLAGVLGKLLGTWVMALFALPLYVAFVVILLVVMFGVMYYAWRDICGEGQRDSGSDLDQIEL